MASPSSSPYLETIQKRFHDRSLLLRRDVDMLLEGLTGKRALIEDVQKQILRHRREDIAQLSEARRDIWASWEERLRRLEQWMRSAAELRRMSGTLSAWRESAQGFERLQSIAEKYKSGLTRRTKSMDDEISSLTEVIQQWDARLCGKEADLRAFLERQAAKTTELMVSKARKQPYLDFVYVEREEESRLSLRMKSLRGTVNKTIDRLRRAEEWVTRHGNQDPAQFGKQKDSFVRSLEPYLRQFAGLRDKALEQALMFEAGRQRLRWIYEQVQRMRIVPELNDERAPLIQRIFRSGDY